MVRVVLDLERFGHLELADPVAELTATALAEVRPVLRAAEAAARAGRWVAGFVAYEAAPALDSALRVRPGAPGPLAWFGVFEAPADQGSNQGSGSFLFPFRGRETGNCLTPLQLAPEVGAAAHAAAVERLREAMGRGDAYQVNLTLRLRGGWQGDPLALYRRLRGAQGGGQGALQCCYIQRGDRALVSASPELFFERRGDRLRLRPMKGTAPRGRYEAEDAGLAAALLASEKDRAENVMITDLMRNDAGRVARPGSVEVTALCALERYPTVHQLTSTVEATLQPGTTLEALFAALFPCGSVTGAPKAAAMALIAAEERSPRGPYCGAVGALAPGGDAAFNVAIRTLDLDLATGEAAYGVGGGITWGSAPAAEWAEALAKARVLEDPGPPCALLETLRVEDGACALLDLHLARLASSARLLGFALDPAAARAAVAGAAAAHPAGAHRVRLLLDPGGALRTEVGPAPAALPGAQPVALAGPPVRREDRRLFHKTTLREPYDARRRLRPDCFDVVLVNEEGEVTELTIGNLVAELDGVRLTPPLTAGLLPGVQRAALLARGEVQERSLRPEDLRRATRLWLVNALRGWVPIRLVD